jgi:hypothetical protein
MHGLGIRVELHANTRGRRDFLALGRTSASILISPASVVAFLETSAFAATTEIPSLAAAKFARAAVPPIAAMRTIAGRKFTCRFFRRIVASPGGTQVEAAQKVAEGIGFRIAHGAGAYRNSPQ